MEKNIKEAIIDFLKKKSIDKENVFSFKRKIAKELKIPEPSNILLLRLYQIHNIYPFQVHSKLQISELPI